MKNLLSQSLEEKVEESYTEGVVRETGLEAVSFKEKVVYRPDVIEKNNLRDMKETFHDQQAAKEAEGKIIYKTYLRQNKGLSYKMSIITPGEVGDEFHKTRGHFHRNATATEVYFVLGGKGILLMQHRRTDRCIFAPLEVGNLVNVPPYYAHCAVNIGNEGLILLSFFPRTSGTDRKLLREKGGFKYLIVERNGKADLKGNPDFWS